MRENFGIFGREGGIDSGFRLSCRAGKPPLREVLPGEIEMALATEKQKNWIKKLVKQKNAMEDINYDTLTKRDASAIIDRLRGTEKKDGEYPVVKGGKKVNDYELGKEVGMCFKLVHAVACDASGDIPPAKRDNFVQTVTGMAQLYRECLQQSRASA